MITSGNCSATNNAIGAMQLMNLGSIANGNKHALTTSEGGGSLLLGGGTISNKHAIVAGSDDNSQVSHGDGSITAGGGFWIGANGIYSNINGFVCNTNFIPASSNAYDLGTVAMPWRDLYLGSNSVYMGSTKVLSLSPNGSNLVVNVPVVTTNGTPSGIPFPTNTWVAGYVISSSNGGTNTYATPMGGGGLADGSTFVSVWTGPTNKLYIVNSAGTYTNLISTTWNQ
jgi:hypothetical protein